MRRTQLSSRWSCSSSRIHRREHSRRPPPRRPTQPAAVPELALSFAPPAAVPPSLALSGPRTSSHLQPWSSISARRAPTSRGRGRFIAKPGSGARLASCSPRPPSSSWPAPARRGPVRRPPTWETCMRSERRRRYHLAALVLSAGVGTLACSSPHSFVVLELELEHGSPPISGIESIRVEVTQGTASIQALSYPAPGLVIDAVVPTADGGATDVDGGAGSPKTLSVEFSNGVKGTVSFDVAAVDGSGCIIGQRRADVVIRRGAVAQGIIPLVPRHDCTADGGSTDGGGDDGATFAGCNPRSPSSGSGLLARLVSSVRSTVPTRRPTACRAAPAPPAASARATRTAPPDRSVSITGRRAARRKFACSFAIPPRTARPSAPAGAARAASARASSPATEC